MSAWSPVTGDFVTFGAEVDTRGVGAGCSEGNRWFTQLELHPSGTTLWVRPDGDAIVGTVGEIWVLDGDNGEVLRSAVFMDEPNYGQPSAYFPGCGVLMQRELGIAHKEVAALDIRNQCSGFLYALSVGDQFIKTGMYKNILVVGSEMHSMGLDFSTRGRNVTVIFGDGAGAVVLQPTEAENQGILTTKLHADGTDAEKLAFINPGAHGGYHQKRIEDETDYGYPPADTYGEIFITPKMMEEGLLYPNMEGQFVFKMAARKFPEVIQEALTETGFTTEDITMLIPHQANLRISQMVQRSLKLRDDQVWNNIQKYGNTTAASVPIALCEAWEAGKIQRGDLVCLAAFGSGFTWASALIRW